MLQRLFIKNFTLIDQLDIPFEGGFSVITGETGAGKSIILGALGLLLGQRADTKAIKAGRDRCVVEAHFDLRKYDMQKFFEENDLDYDGGDCILRREVTTAGKSRAFVNDTPVPLTTLRELGGMLVDIHSQHQNLLLNKEDFQLNVLDIISNDAQELSSYQTSYQEYKTLTKEIEAKREQLRRSRESEDFLRFQLNELETARLVDGEQEELESEQEMLSHAEDIKSALYEADNLLSGDGGAVERLKSASHSIEGVKDVFRDIAGAAERLESCFIELKDIADEVASRSEDVEFDPARLEAVDARLDTLYSLERKYHVENVAQLLSLQKDIERQLGQIDGGDEELQQMETRLATLLDDCEQKATKLTNIRTNAARKVEAEMRQRLVPLGIPKVRFEVLLQEKPLANDGHDKVAFLFTANSSTPLQPVAQVASGGEIARVMLSLKAMISGAVKLPTIIFDEIDTGVSGKVAEMMAHIMQEMGDNDRQVISITHLPQIAAKGARHYKVYKEEGDEGTTSHMRLLNHDERVREIAQMVSGSDISQAAIRNAEELLGKTTNE
ncbi:MAG: DNA repair protein RecN [Prevotella sp.]|jgi:DNA repair protein RecN (Recombination protein N)|nr:DNA repair protein RecN [Prevotella sp.]